MWKGVDNYPDGVTDEIIAEYFGDCREESPPLDEDEEEE